MDVKVTDAEVKKSFDEQKKQSFPKDADYKKFLSTSGQTEEDILQRVKLDLLSNKIRDKVVKGKDKVSDKAIEDFYNKNKARFAQPEKRDLRVVLTKDKADADKAKAALESGDSWNTVAKKYSIDDTSKAAGGKLPAQAKGTLDKELDDAVFSAKKNELEGPIKTQYGYYVFTVSDDHRGQPADARRGQGDHQADARRPRASRRRLTPSSRTSRSAGRTRPSAPRTTRPPTARTVRRPRRPRRRARRPTAVPPQTAPPTDGTGPAARGLVSHTDRLRRDAASGRRFAFKVRRVKATRAGDRPCSRRLRRASSGADGRRAALVARPDCLLVAYPVSADARRVGAARTSSCGGGTALGGEPTATCAERRGHRRPWR